MQTTAFAAGESVIIKTLPSVANDVLSATLDPLGKRMGSLGSWLGEGDPALDDLVSVVLDVGGTGGVRTTNGQIGHGCLETPCTRAHPV